MAPRTALLAGATGLVGGHCLTTLLDCGRYDRVITLVRRPLALRHARLEQVVADFEKLNGLDSFSQAVDIFCSLGTTIKRAGSQAAFLHVDYDFPKTIASLSASAGARQFLLVSSVGADPRSPNFYLRVKGDLEKAVSEMPFESVHIFRPSILTGDRGEKRPLESVGIAISRAIQFALIGSLRKYRPMPAPVLASAVVAAASEARPGRHIYHFDEIRRLAGQE